MNRYEDYIELRFKIIRGLLNDFPKSRDQETIHQYRVEFKKLKAVYHLAVFCHAESNEGNVYRKYKKLYNHTGKIRDIDIIKELLEKYHVTLKAEVKERLLNKREKNAEKIKRHIADYTNSAKTLRRKLLKNSTYLNKGCTAGYLTYLHSKIVNDLHIPEFEIALHSIRKMLKQLRYIAEIEPEIIPKENLSYYITLDAMIGSWHDKIILIEFLGDKQAEDKSIINMLVLKNKRDLLKIRSKLSKLTIQKSIK